MCVDAAAVLINLILACVLVIGLCGIESWGIAGRRVGDRRRPVEPRRDVRRHHARPAQSPRLTTRSPARLDRDAARRLVRFGGPSGVQMLLEVSGFTLFVLLVGRLGGVEREATSLVFRVSQLAFMPVWGFGIATVVLVGQRLGEDRPDLARRAARPPMRSRSATWAPSRCCSSRCPTCSSLVRQRRLDVAARKRSRPRSLPCHLMRFVAAYNMFDATLIIFSSVLRGAGDTKFIMRLSMASRRRLIGATWLAVEVHRTRHRRLLDDHHRWIWLLAVVYVVRYRQGKWRSMRVIDQVHAPGSRRDRRAVPAATLHASGQPPSIIGAGGRTRPSSQNPRHASREHGRRCPFCRPRSRAAEVGAAAGRLEDRG